MTHIFTKIPLPPIVPGEPSAARIYAEHLPGFIYSYDAVSSVLDIAHSMEHTLDIWGSILAIAQHTGRGQFHRVWHSPAGNLYAAVRLPPSPPFQGMEAAPALSAFIVSSLQHILGQNAPTFYIKWPNDIVVSRQNRLQKIGGILLEERNQCLIAGIGINLTTAPIAPQLDPKAALEAGVLHEAAQHMEHAVLRPHEFLWARLLKHMEDRHKKFMTYDYFWDKVANEHLLWKNETVLLTENEQTLQGTLLGLGNTGGVRLRVDGHVKEFFSGSLHPT